MKSCCCQQISLTAMAAVLWVGLLSAQGPRQVEVQVTAVAGGSVYLDKGREAKIEAGDELVLHPAGGGLLQGIIRTVSKTNARAVLLNGGLASGVGVRGHVLVPEARFESAGAKDPAKRSAPAPVDVPDHPPWSNPLGENDSGLPLLAPAFGRAPEERPTEWRGRVFASILNTWDNGRATNRFLLARLGTDLSIENPFKGGGSIDFRGELDQREFSAPGQSEATTQGRIDRFSYRWGDTAGAPIRWQVGRFLQPLFPEFGLLDGAAADMPTGRFSRTGLSMGFFPEPFPTNNFEENFQTSIYHRYANSEEEQVVLGIGFQKTWHRGNPDRDLLLATADLHPIENLYVHSTLWLDIYTSADRIKSTGLQVTQFHLSGDYRFDKDHGLGMNFSHLRWPELLRDEFIRLSPQTIRNNRVDRFGFNTWHQLTEELRVDGRLDFFDDQDTSGVSGNLRFALRDFLFSHGGVSFDLFSHAGSFSDGRGFRLGVNRYFDGYYLNLSYEWSEFDTQVLVAGASDLIQQAILAGMNFSVAGSTDISLTLDYRFGDSQNALTLGVFSQTRF